MAEYYFTVSTFPELVIGHVPKLGYKTLKPLLEVNLRRSDYLLTKRFLRLIDLDNFLALWLGEPLDPRGNLNEEELRNALLDYEWEKEDFPEYMRTFLQKYPKDAERAANYFILVSQYLEEEGSKEGGFLQKLFEFEKQFRLVMVGFRAKRLGRDVAKELLYEDATDPIVAQILAQKDAKGYEPPFEFKELKPLFDEYADRPAVLQQHLLEYKFHTIIELTGGAIFTMERVLGYMARLLIVERWIELDVQKGIKVVDEIIEEVKS